MVRQRFGGQALFDSLVWFVAIFGAGILRFEFDLGWLRPNAFVIVGLSLAVLGFAVGKILGLYRSRFTPATFDELLALLLTAGLAAAPVALAAFFWGPMFDFPRSAVAIAVPLFLLGSGGSRVLRRFLRRTRPILAGAKKSIIFGAGAMSENLIPQLLNDKKARFLPVGLIDDDPTKSNRWIAGVKMMGTLADLGSVIDRTAAQALIVSIPRANSETLRRVNSAAAPLGLEVHVLPSLSEVLGQSDSPIALRNLGIEDLVGRRAVVIDSPRVSSLLAGQTVLVTGAGGSIGIELCRQVAAFNPQRLVFLDRDETGLQQAQLAAYGDGLLDSDDLVLADIRDAEAVDKAFALHNPDVIFHAAALKHLPMLEKFPEEAWKTNIEGTLNVLTAAQRSKVTTFVNISTDKAAEPSSVLGRSKRVAEELTGWASREGAGNYLSVRFGNVLGSRGSLVPTLASLIDSGGPITLTSADATRYFMTISEACQLVLQAGTETEKNSIFVLDMGQPVRIAEIAERMIAMSGKEIEIRFSGLRRGEKLHEVLLSKGEELAPSSHNLVGRLASNVLNPRGLEALRKDFL